MKLGSTNIIRIYLLNLMHARLSYVQYLVVAKGEVLLAVIFNPLLFALRGMRDWFTFITSQVLQKGSPNGQANSSDTLKKESYGHLSAKESVVRKWGSD